MEIAWTDVEDTLRTLGQQLSELRGNGGEDAHYAKRVSSVAAAAAGLVKEAQTAFDNAADEVAQKEADAIETKKGLLAAAQRRVEEAQAKLDAMKAGIQ